MTFVIGYTYLEQVGYSDIRQYEKMNERMNELICKAVFYAPTVKAPGNEKRTIRLPLK